MCSASHISSVVMENQKSTFRDFRANLNSARGVRVVFEHYNQCYKRVVLSDVEVGSTGGVDTRKTDFKPSLNSGYLVVDGTAGPATSYMVGDVITSAAMSVRANAEVMSKLLVSSRLGGEVRSSQNLKKSCRKNYGSQA